MKEDAARKSPLQPWSERFMSGLLNLYHMPQRGPAVLPQPLSLTLPFAFFYIFRYLFSIEMLIGSKLAAFMIAAIFGIAAKELITGKSKEHTR